MNALLYFSDTEAVQSRHYSVPQRNIPFPMVRGTRASQPIFCPFLDRRTGRKTSFQVTCTGWGDVSAFPPHRTFPLQAGCGAVAATPGMRWGAPWLTLRVPRNTRSTRPATESLQGPLLRILFEGCEPLMQFSSKGDLFIDRLL